MKKIQQSLLKHQFDYSMLTAKPPVAICICGVRSEIDLPEDIRGPAWYSSNVDKKEREAHTMHQTDMLYKEVFQQGLQF